MTSEEMRACVQNFLAQLNENPDMVMQISGTDPHGYGFTVTLGPQLAENRLVVDVQLHKGAGVPVTDEDVVAVSEMLHFLMGWQPENLIKADAGADVLRTRMRMAGGGIG